MHFKVGMRIVKTVVAVFICCIIDYWRGALPLQSTMAAIICIQPSTENTVNEAVSRILATLLGSASATLMLMIFSKTGVVIPSFLSYAVISLMLIPLITVTVRMGWPSATALTCIIFLAIALGYTGESGLFMTALNRMVDTLVGILVALPINALLPNHLTASASGPEKEAAEAPSDGSGESEEKQ